MKLKNVDGEWYLDRISKVFFKDDIIPDEFKDATKYDVFVLDSNRPKSKEEMKDVHR
jgi:hypothetical protein